MAEAEADGNRTRQRRGTPLCGFEDRRQLDDRPLLRVEPTPGLSDSAHSVYLADGAHRIGSPEDDFESDGVSWVPLADVSSLIGRGDITPGTTLAALLYVVAPGHLAIGRHAPPRDGPALVGRHSLIRAICAPSLRPGGGRIHAHVDESEL